MATIARTIFRNSYSISRAMLARNYNILQTNICLTVNMTDRRYYAKGKDKKKEKSKKIEINENELSQLVDVNELKTNLESTLNSLKEDYSAKLSLRSNTSAIENLQIDIDGKKHNLIEVAQVIRKNPKLITLNLAVFPQAIPGTMKALINSGMNLNPQQDGNMIYVPIPKITREHREGLSRTAKALFVKCKDNLRNIQTKYVKTLKNKQTSEKISEDLTIRVSQQIVFLADQYIAQAEKQLEQKQNELLSSSF